METAASLPSSGYWIFRSSWNANGDYLLFDCGEQAAGMRTDGVPNAMHGHADCLSVIAWLQGRPVLVDSGLFAYNCGGHWERHFRETAAHNTAKVDGKDQARHIKSMAWTHSYRAVCEGWKAIGERAWVVGSHDGFARGPAGVVHRRAVWLRPDSYLVVYDEFVGSGAHELSVNYQFAPGPLELGEHDNALFDGRVELAWASSERWRPALACGGPDAGDGWIAPSLGIRQAAPRLTLECAAQVGRTSLLTVVASRDETIRSRVSVMRAASGGPLIVANSDGSTDIIRAAGMHAAEELIQTDALLAVCRVADGEVHAVSIGDLDVRYDAARLRDLADSVSMGIAVG